MDEVAGICRRHYAQERRGQVPTNGDWRYVERPCPVPGCDRKMKGVSRVCVKHHKICWRYSMTPEQLVDLYARGCCDICGSTHLLSVDHDHSCCDVEFGTCGKCNRGLLCRSCNSALGLVKDDPERIWKMLEYLGQYVQD